MREEFYLYIIAFFNDVPHYVYESLLSIFFVGVVLLIAWQRKNSLKWIAKLFFIDYIFLIYASTVIFRTVKDANQYETAPFWSYIAIMEGRQDLIVESAMNFIIFIPIGMLIPCIFPNRKWWQLVFGGFFYHLP